MTFICQIKHMNSHKREHSGDLANTELHGDPSCTEHLSCCHKLRLLRGHKGPRSHTDLYCLEVPSSGSPIHSVNMTLDAVFTRVPSALAVVPA